MRARYMLPLNSGKAYGTCSSLETSETTFDGKWGSNATPPTKVNRFAWVAAIPRESPRDCPHATTGDTHCFRENAFSSLLVEQSFVWCGTSNGLKQCKKKKKRIAAYNNKKEKLFIILYVYFQFSERNSKMQFFFINSEWRKHSSRRDIWLPAAVRIFRGTK